MRILHQGAPWNEYARQTINLSEDWKEFFITFEMPVDDVSSRAGIIMGLQKRLMSGLTISASTKANM